MGIYDNFRLRIWGRLQFQGEVSRSWSYSSWLVMKGLDPKRVPARRSCVMVWGHPLPVTWMLVDNARFFYCYVRSAWHIFRHTGVSKAERPKKVHCDGRKLLSILLGFIKKTTCAMRWSEKYRKARKWANQPEERQSTIQATDAKRTVDHSNNQYTLRKWPHSQNVTNQPATTIHDQPPANNPLLQLWFVCQIAQVDLTNTILWIAQFGRSMIDTHQST